MATEVRTPIMMLILLIVLSSASICGAYADPLRSHRVHNCGGPYCGETRRHPGHSRYHRDAGDHVSFRLFHKKF